MRSYPGLVTRVLREKAFRKPVSSVSVRSLGASTTSHHVGPAAAAAVATAGRARTGEGHVGALRQGFGEDGARWGSVCAASAAAVAVLGADGISDNKVCDRLHDTTCSRIIYGVFYTPSSQYWMYNDDLI